jgi:hypothetical protein
MVMMKEDIATSDRWFPVITILIRWMTDFPNKSPFFTLLLNAVVYKYSRTYANLVLTRFHGFFNVIFSED